jgi:hypothetical protein
MGYNSDDYVPDGSESEPDDLAKHAHLFFSPPTPKSLPRKETQRAVSARTRSAFHTPRSDQSRALITPSKSGKTAINSLGINETPNKRSLKRRFKDVRKEDESDPSVSNDLINPGIYMKKTVTIKKEHPDAKKKTITPNKEMLMGTQPQQEEDKLYQRTTRCIELLEDLSVVKIWMRRQGLYEGKTILLRTYYRRG